MDPYETLGVHKNCTRDELKDAFRTKAQLVHPDRGGDAAAFIQLRQAFDQVKDDLRRRPPDQPVVIAEPSTGQTHRSRPPDPDWDPELIIRDEPLPRRRPGRPHDPNWQPDLILGDEEPRSGPVSNSRDPRFVRENESGWVRRFMARTAAKGRSSEEPEWHLTGVLALVIAIAVTVWICWAAWSYDSSDDKADPLTGYDPLRAHA